MNKPGTMLNFKHREDLRVEFKMDHSCTSGTLHTFGDRYREVTILEGRVQVNELGALNSDICKSASRFNI